MKILVLLSRMPYPLEKGDKLRAFQQIKALSGRHEIHLFALNAGKLHPEALDKLKPFCRSIKVVSLSRIHIFINLINTIFRGIPFQAGYFFSNAILLKVEERIKKLQPDLVYCQLIRMAEYAKELHGIPKVIDYQDLFSRGMEQRAERAAFYLKPFLKYEAKLLKRYENKVFGWFDEHIIISSQDRSFMTHPDKEKVHIIPNSIDRNVFSIQPCAKKTDLLFVGNMNYEPNIDCAVYMVKEILPLVKKEIPDATLEIAGANPNAKVLALASPAVSITGWVDDMRPIYAKARVFCAPMRMGTGLQNKLLEAMASKVPCVTTSLCNNALKAVSGKSILIGDTSQDFARHIISLLKSEESSAILSSNAYEFITMYYDEQVVIRQLESILLQLKNKKA